METRIRGNDINLQWNIYKMVGGIITAEDFTEATEVNVRIFSGKTFKNVSHVIQGNQVTVSFPASMQIQSGLFGVEISYINNGIKSREAIERAFRLIEYRDVASSGVPVANLTISSIEITSTISIGGGITKEFLDEELAKKQDKLKAGTNITIASDGTISATGGSGGGASSWDDISGKPNFAAVATSGSYSDLSDKPTIPAAVSVVNGLTSTSTTAALSAAQGKALNENITQLDEELAKKQDKLKAGTNITIASDGTISATGGSGGGASSWDDISGKPNFAAVATSGSYSDLSDKPTIPAAVSVVNGLTSTSTTAALSAAQGKALNENIAQLEAEVSKVEKLEKNIELKSDRGILLDNGLSTWEDIMYPVTSNNTEGSSYSIKTINNQSLPFDKIVEMQYLSIGSGAHRVNTQFCIGGAKKSLHFSFWMRTKYTAISYSSNAVLRFRKGYPKGIVKLTENISVVQNTVNTIKSNIDTNGIHELGTSTYFRKYIDAYLPYDDDTIVVHICCESIQELLLHDCITITIGKDNAQVRSFDDVYAGFMLLDYIPTDPIYSYDQRNPEGIFKIRSELNLNKIDYLNTYKLFDKAKNCFEGGQTKIKAYGMPLLGIPTMLRLMDGIEITKVDNFCGGYKLSMEDDSDIPFYINHSTINWVFNLQSGILSSAEDRSKTVFQCWINVDELNGNGIAWNWGTTGANSLITPIELLTKGYISTRDQEDSIQNKNFEVIDVIGSYSCLRFYYSNTHEAYNEVKYSIYNVSGDAVKSITLYNPTFISSQNPDPYHLYQSKALSLGYNSVGKTAMLIGDSQYNDGVVVARLCEDLGLNVIDATYGGHRIKYNNSTAVNTNSKSWFYSTYLRDNALGYNVDMYILTMSTNDNDGGGLLTQDAINDVLSKYPAYGDTEDEIADKLTIFNALSEDSKSEIFDYMQTYSAYIIQMLRRNPLSKIVLCTVPIACTGRLTGEAVPNPSDVSQNIGEWKEGQSPEIARTALNGNYTKINTEIKQIAEWFGADCVDLKNKVGLTFENFTQYCYDGTHWSKDIKHRMADAIINIPGLI